MFKKIVIPMIPIALCGLLLVSCEKNEQDASFRGVAKVYFAPLDAGDSLQYSFANFPAAVEKDTFLVLDLSGNLSDRDRRVNVEVDPTGTTAQPSEYEIGQQALIPANAVHGILPIKLKVSPRLDSEIVELTLRLRSSEDLEVNPERPGKINELVKFRVVWTNALVEPADWPTRWGRYSQVKHRLVIDQTGYAIYSGENWDLQKMMVVTGVCNEWIDAYNAAHPGAPYADENGVPIRFCLNCN